MKRIFCAALTLMFLNVPTQILGMETIEIRNAEELITFANRVNSGESELSACLKGDITLGVDWTPIKLFKGEIDGEGHSIFALNIKGGEEDYTGFVSVLDAAGTIKDLSFHGAVGGKQAGAVVGQNFGVVENVISYVHTFGTLLAGGIACENSGSISSCTVLGETGTDDGSVGGIAAKNAGVIENCDNQGDICSSLWGHTKGYAAFSGGIAGENSGTLDGVRNAGKINGGSVSGGIAGTSTGEIKNAVNYAPVSGKGDCTGGIAGESEAEILTAQNFGRVDSKAKNTGGIVGRSTALVRDCVNFGDVSALLNAVGGIVGHSKGEVLLCENRGTITGEGENVGGIVGHSLANITSSINSGAVSGDAVVAGIAAYCDGGAVISNCANEGAVSVLGRLGGGVCAYITSKCVIDRSYNSGSVASAISGVGNFSGGVCAQSYGTVSNVYTSGAVTGKSTVGGIVAYNGGTLTNSFNCSTPKKVTANKSSSALDENSYAYGADDSALTDGTLLALLGEAFEAGEKHPVIKGAPQKTTNSFEPYIAQTADGLFFDAADACVQSSENTGVSYDIYATYKGSVAYFFMPSTASREKINITVLNTNGERTTLAPNAEQLVLNNVLYPVCIMYSDLPAMYIEIDEQYGTLEKMNTSSDHSEFCYGDMRLDVPQALAEARGWKETYVSEEKEEDSYGTMKMRGRGNTTWSTYFDSKKPYQIRTENKLNLLEMGDAKKWLLIKNEAVRADVLRVYQKMALDLARELGIQYTPQSEFIDLYINGEYLGTYLVTEKVEIGTERVNITDLEKLFEDGLADENTDMTGGYLLEIGNYLDDEKVISTNGNDVVISSPSILADTPTATNEYAYIYNRVTKLFDAVYSFDISYLDDIDIESFVKNFWLHEFLTNTDCGRGSTFFYKDIDAISTKFFAGPAWDFDYIFYQSEGWYLPGLNRAGTQKDVPVIYNKLAHSKEFVSYAIYYFEKNNMAQVFSNVAEKVREYQTYIESSAQMNKIRWNKKGAYLTNTASFAESRAKWLNANYTSLADVATEGEFINVEEPPLPTRIEDYTIYTAINPQSKRVAENVSEMYKRDDDNVIVKGMEAAVGMEWENPYYEVKFSSSGYDNITFSARLGATKKGPKNYALSYSTDGGNTFNQLAQYSVMKNKVMEHAFIEVNVPAANCAEVILRIDIVGDETVGGETTLSATPTSGSCAVSDVGIFAEEAKTYISNVAVEDNRVDYSINAPASGIDATTYICAYSGDMLSAVSSKKTILAANADTAEHLQVNTDGATHIKIMLQENSLVPLGLPFLIPCG
ncbi:MAG: CotH kinase family protein [Clostridia bacterium]|nr:CotH kinase family protein [Clostridia bacterium]